MQSMTGFGRASISTSDGPVLIEIKSTNHKYFELTARLPQPLLSREEDIRKIVQSKIRRGKVFLSLQAPEKLLRAGVVVFDTKLAKSYASSLKKIAKTAGVKGEVSISDLIKLPDVVTTQVSPAKHIKLWQSVKPALNKAVTALAKSRSSEAGSLLRDLKSRILKIKRSTANIQKRSAKLVTEYKSKQSKKKDFDAESFVQELASYAKSTDITEEMVRLNSHIAGFEKTLKAGGEIGRRLDFIAQEMIRETNTTGAKCQDAAVSDHVIDIKSELEKIREQSMNLE